jgi:hypothetical protein
MALFSTPIRGSSVSIVGLADRVYKLSTQIKTYLDDGRHAHPDFTSNSALLPESPGYDRLRNQLTDAAMDLLRLTQGPKNILRTMSFSHTDLAATQVALSRNFFRLVPDDNVGLSASEIATATSMDDDRANRVLKMLATHRIFEEVDGKFRHTALSNFLKTDLYRTMAEEQLHVCFKATSDMDDWIEASPYNSSVKDSPFYRQFKKDFYKYHSEDEERGKRFSDAMRSWGTSVYLCVQYHGLELTLIAVDNSFKVLRDNYDWTSVANKKVVDIGGGNGHVSIDLARVRGRSSSLPGLTDNTLRNSRSLRSPFKTSRRSNWRMGMFMILVTASSINFTIITRLSRFVTLASTSAAQLSTTTMTQSRLGC